MSDIEENKSVSERREDILERIQEAANKANRDDAPSLVAVSKVQPDHRVEAGLDCGQRVFGENRVQEAYKRWDETFQARRKDVRLHLIGPLQTNKAEEAVKLFDVIETLDREKLVKAVLKAAEKVGKMPELLVQVNTGEEAQKSGVHPQELNAFLERLDTEYNLRPQGLMCIPPVGQAVSPHFWLLQKMAQEQGMKILSMGMSGDFETAIAFGATHVRVGSALFGPRNYA